MAIKGTVTAKCSGKGCLEEDVEVWSFVRGDTDPDLRERLIAGDLNLITCETCGALYFPEATVVYYDPGIEMLAFIFPESYKKEEARWRKKMLEDYGQMKTVLGDKKGVEYEPVLFFGMDAAASALNSEENLEDEVHIAKILAPGLDLDIFSVDRAYARKEGLPRMLPHMKKKSAQGGERESVLAALMILLKENGKLSGYRRWVSRLSNRGELPTEAGLR